jgi:hypothetical protein
MAVAVPELFSPQRIILRFRTVNSPSDEDMTKAFFNRFGFTSDQCYFHWQPREYKHTHVVIDVHCGVDSISNFQDLPHRVYRVYKKDGDEAMQDQHI